MLRYVSCLQYVLFFVIYRDVFAEINSDLSIDGELLKIESTETKFWPKYLAFDSKIVVKEDDASISHDGARWVIWQQGYMYVFAVKDNATSTYYYMAAEDRDLMLKPGEIPNFHYQSLKTDARVFRYVRRYGGDDYVLQNVATGLFVGISNVGGEQTLLLVPEPHADTFEIELIDEPNVAPFCTCMSALLLLWLLWKLRPVGRREQQGEIVQCGFGEFDPEDHSPDNYRVADSYPNTTNDGTFRPAQNNHSGRSVCSECTNYTNTV